MTTIEDLDCEFTELNNEAFHLLHDLNPYEQEAINSADKLIGSAKQRVVLGFDSRIEMEEKR